MKTKKHTVRLLALVLLCVLTFGSYSMAIIVPPDSPDASAYISSYSVSLINGGNGKLKVDFAVTGTGVMSKIGSTCIKIYTGSGSLVATIRNTDPGRSGMLKSNDYYHSDVETYNVTPGSYYVKVSIYAKNSSGSDEIVVTTGCKTIT